MSECLRCTAERLRRMCEEKQRLEKRKKEVKKIGT